MGCWVGAGDDQGHLSWVAGWVQEIIKAIFQLAAVWLLLNQLAWNF